MFSGRIKLEPLANAKRLLPRGLLARSLLIVITPLILLQVVTAYIFYERHWDTITRRLALDLAGDVALIVEFMSDFPDEEQRQWMFDLARDRMDIRASYREGDIFDNQPPSSDGGLLTDSMLRALDERVRRPIMVDTGNDRGIAVQVQLGSGVLELVTTRKRLFSTTTYLFALWMVGVSMILVGIATVFMRNQVRSIRRLAVAADAFGKGRDVPDFKIQGATEVRQVGGAFNLMRERIKRQITQRTEMLAGVSHDLRTPLTRMKLELAMMPDDFDGAAELRSDVAEMEKMVEGYLAFARGEGGEAVRETDLAVLLGEVVGGAKREGAAIDLHVEDELWVPLRPDAFRRCLANVIGNAVRYARHVWVRAGRRGDMIDITIDDDGPGIPREKREAVFKPFHRLDESRNPETGGVGLGLTIARDIIRGHGGDIVLDDAPTGGLRLRLHLPL